jgi:hypothetical protein
MLDIKIFNFENQVGFDFKGFLIKIGSYWKWFLSLLISYTIAYQVNIRKRKFMQWKPLFLKEENNPLFTSKYKFNL